MPPDEGRAATKLNGELHRRVYEMADAPKLEWFIEAARRLLPFQIPNTFHQVPNRFEENRTAHGQPHRLSREPGQPALGGSSRAGFVTSICVIWSAGTPRGRGSGRMLSLM